MHSKRKRKDRPPARPAATALVPHEGFRRVVDGQGRLAQHAMDEAMAAIAQQIGVRADDAILLRLADNAIYALPSARLVVRISRSHRLHDRVLKTVRLGRWFERIHAPTIRLAKLPVDQPLATGGLLASAWFYQPGTATPPTVADLGRVLRDLHRIGAPPFKLPVWDPIGDARARLGDAEDVSDRDRTILLDWCDALQPRYDAMMTQSGGYVVHGNAHPGNLVRDYTGQVILGDFDATCLGPWQADLAAVPVAEIRFRRWGMHKQLAYAYGYDVTADPWWPILRDVRELSMIAGAATVAGATPAASAEFANRLNCILWGDHDSRWTPFAEIALSGRTGRT